MLYIIRHGKTDWNVRHKMQGRTDIPLNEEGRQMAEAAREDYRDVHFDICFCSPLIRAKETAEILPDIPELGGSGDQELDLIKLAGSLLSDTGIGIAMVRLSDHQVVQVYGNPQLHEGETLDAEPDGSGLLTIGDTLYIAGAAQDEAYRIYAMVPVSEIGTKMVLSPVSLALIFAMTFNMPCIVALAATYQETHSVKWTARIALYYTGVALVLAGIAYYVGLLIW